MKNKIISAFSAIIICIFLCGAVSAQQVKVEGLNFKLGDDVNTVKTALHTNIDPEPMASSSINPNTDPNRGKTYIHLRSKGIWVFFNKKGILETIRFDAPYEASIAGVKLGDSEAKVRSVMGKPIKEPWAFGPNRAFQYALDDTAYIRFDISDTDGVQAIFINK
jgi:hypothetical protein